MQSKKLIYILLSLIFLSFSYILIHFESISHNIFMFINTEKVNPYYEFFLGLITFFGITLIVIIFKNKSLLNIWLIKAFVTLFLMLVYEWVYKLDAYRYYASAINSSILKNAINLDFGISGTQNVMIINNFFTYIVGDSYFSLKIFNSFIAFIGLILLYKSYEYIIKKNQLRLNKRFIYFFFLFPSVIFWSSILGKDPLNLFFIGLFSYGFIHLIDHFKLRYLLMIIISIWLVSYIRSWWSIIMVTSIFFYYLKINSVRNFILFLIVMPIFIIISMQFLQTQGVTSMEQLFSKMTITSTKLAYGNSSLSVHVITSLSDYLLWFFPNLFTTLFRPMPWDIRNAFTLIAAVENVVLFYLFYKYIFKNWRLIYANKYLKFYILLILSWSLLYVIISPTNLGMAVRFKLQVLPLMLILIGVSKLLIVKRKELTSK